MKRLLHLFLLVVLYLGSSVAQTATVTRNVNLRPDASTDKSPVTKLTPGTHLKLLDPNSVSAYKNNCPAAWN
jgi:hypothetical protein